MAETKITQNEITQPSWTTVTYGTGWTSFDGTFSSTNYGGGQYLKDALGFVHLRGLVLNNSGGVNTGTTNQTLFTLPAGFRPAFKLRFTVTNSAAGTDAWSEVDIAVTGALTLINPSVNNNGWVSINGITFLGEV